eukprot:Clim_evm81s25 gene=Clim_evmTU81s25
MHISEAEARFIIEGVADGLRTDGRGCLDHRQAVLECDIASNTRGSCRVRLAGTDVLVGIKTEIDVPDPNKPNQGKVNVNVDLSSHAAAVSGSVTRRVLEAREQDLSSTLQNLLLPEGVLDPATLIIIPRRQCWILYIDAVVVTSGGGSLVDALSLAVKGAIMTCSVPKVTVVYGENKEPIDITLSSDPYDAEPLKLKSPVPVIATMVTMGTHYVADADREEEAVADASVSVSVNSRKEVCGMQMTGRTGISPQNLFKIMRSAKDIGSSTAQAVETFIKNEQEEKRRHAGQLQGNDQPRGYLAA